ncbi:hypothetical protein ACMBCM_07060 [Spiroplasma sp. K1]
MQIINLLIKYIIMWCVNYEIYFFSLNIYIYIYIYIYITLVYFIYN